MFGIGFQEMLLVGLLFLVLFGPRRLPQMARDLGSFASKAQHMVDELKTDLMSGVEEDRKPQKKVGNSKGPGAQEGSKSTLRS